MTKEMNLTGYPSIDKPWSKYYSERDLTMQVPQKTVYDNIFESNREHLNDIAFLYYGRCISYRELFEQVEVCASALTATGVKKGDVVTLLTAGMPEAVYLMLACNRLGALANFLNPLFEAQQKIDRINETEGTVLFALDKMLPYLQDVVEHTCIKEVVVIPAANTFPPHLKILSSLRDRRLILQVGASQHLSSWRDFISRGAGQAVTNCPYEKDLPAIMVYSSGTTGASKGIVLTNDGINATIANYQTASFRYQRGDSFLWMIPVWFSTGIVISCLMPLRQGITVIPEMRFNKDAFVHDLRKCKPNMTLVATSIWQSAIRDSKLQKADLSCLQYPITGGEKLLAEDEESITRFLREHHCTRNLIKGYGMCEMGSTVSTSTPAASYRSKTNGAGYPILHAMVAAFHLSTDEECRFGERGEIRVCTPARMKEYYKTPTATSAFFKVDDKGRTWGCTGDIGYVDEDGEVFVLGRATDCFYLDDGEPVYLFDIEDAILRDKDVEQCKVVWLDDEKKLAAHLVLKNDAVDQRISLPRIHKKIMESLPVYMHPYYYKIRQSLPVHANGKRDVDEMISDRTDLLKVSLLTKVKDDQ